MAKEAVASKGSTTQADRKTVRKLEKVQSAFRKSERKVSKLRVQLERAESKLAARVQRLSELESRLQPAESPQEAPHGLTLDGQPTAPGEESGDPVIAYTPLAGFNGAAKQPPARGRKGARSKQ